MQKYSYITGMSHSGSTLLAFLLNAHPEIVSLGEFSRVSSFIPDRWERKADQCSCLKPFYSCEIWNRILAGFAARGYGLGKPDFFDYSRDEKTLAQEKLKAFVEATIDVSGARVFLDASKVPTSIKPLTEHPDLDLRILDLHRDGRGIVNSWHKQLSDTSIKSITKRWISLEAERQAAIRGIAPTLILKVKYEELCRNPEEILQQIFHFLGVASDAKVTTGYKTIVSHHIIGNQMRLTSDEEIRLDDTWRTNLSEESLAAFSKHGGDELNKLQGYF